MTKFWRIAVPIVSIVLALFWVWALEFRIGSIVYALIIILFSIVNLKYFNKLIFGLLVLSIIGGIGFFFLILKAVQDFT